MLYIGRHPEIMKTAVRLLTAMKNVQVPALVPTKKL